MTALIITSLFLALILVVGTCLALLVTLAIGCGERRDLERDLDDAHADLDRIGARNQQLGDELAQVRLDADTLRADVPDAATPDLMAHIDDLPHRRRSFEREMERWADLAGRAERIWRPVVPPHVDPPYVPTAYEVALWDSIVANTHLEAP